MSKYPPQGPALTYPQFMSFPRIELINFTLLRRYFGHLKARFFNYLLLIIIIIIIIKFCVTVLQQTLSLSLSLSLYLHDSGLKLII